MKILMVRHGESEENAKMVTQGQLNTKLSDKGKKQIKKLALRLKDYQINAIHSSDLERAVKTTLEILKFHDQIKPVYTKSLRDQAKGIYEGQPRIKIHKSIQKYMQNTKEISKRIYYEYTPEGGESLVDVEKRVEKFLDEITKKHVDDTVLLVCHGAPIVTTIIAKLGLNRKGTLKYQPCNTALTIFEVNEKGKWKLKLLNCTKHLE